MSRESKSEAPPALTDWQPGASLELLALRAEILRRIRAWFDERGILEVETPALSVAGTTDPALESLVTSVDGADRYLHTSPEFAMKRLLAAGAGDIYQLCRVFRGAERGRLHNPEFTMLEFYRLGYDDHQLMDEVDGLLRDALGGRASLSPTVRMRYGEAMQANAGVDVHADAPALLVARLGDAGVDVPASVRDDRDALLDLLLTTVVEPRMDHAAPTFLFDFPATQAALARIRPGPPPVAARFELFLGGMELANGFHELCDAREQAGRFERDFAARRAAGRPGPPVDSRLLAALRAGMPDCAGVAIGVDRLVMCAAGCETIGDAMSFDFERA